MREFERLRDTDALLEWAEVHGNVTRRRASRPKALAQGRDMLFDIDWQGAQQIREKMRADIVAIFILPPSMKELQARLKRRAEDQDEVIEKRLKNARNEIEHWKGLRLRGRQRGPAARLRRGAGIVAAERLRRDRRPGLFDFVSGLLDGRRDELLFCPRGFFMCKAGDGAHAALRSAARIPRRSSVSARRSRSMPRSVSARVSRSGLAAARPFRLCRSILRRWPKAASVTRPSC